MVLPDAADDSRRTVAVVPEVAESSVQKVSSDLTQLRNQHVSSTGKGTTTPASPPKVQFQVEAPRRSRPKSLRSLSDNVSLVIESLPEPPCYCLFRMVISVYVILTLSLSVWCVVQSVRREDTNWPPIGRILPLIILNSPGSWAIALPMTLGARTREPMGHFLAAAAVLPPAMAGQLLVRTAAGVELQDPGQADVNGMLVGLIQFLLLLAVAALRSSTVSASFPLPFLLGLTLGLGNAVAVAFLPLVLNEEMDTTSVLVPLVSFILMGCIAQLSWGFRPQTDESEQTSLALRLLRDCAAEFQHQTSPAEGPRVVSHYEECMKQMDVVETALRHQPKLSEEVLFEFGHVLSLLKGTLTSGKLYKTEVRGGRCGTASSAPLMSSMSDTSRQQLRQVQQILESECEGVEQIRPRISQASHDSRISEVDQLPHQLPASPKTMTGPKSARSARSSASASGSFVADEQLHFLAQLHRGCFNEMPVSPAEHSEELPPEITDKREVSKLGRWKFDAYAFERQHGNTLLHTGFTIGSELLTEAGISNFKVPLRGFLQDVQKQYHRIPYHNSIHAADVLSSCTYFLREDRRVSRAPLGNVSRLATFVAAVIHDVGHFGRTNRFHVASHDPVAVLYNDQSPLENMHCTIGFSILRQPHSSLFKIPSSTEDECSGLPDADFTLLRRIVIESVLATDMAKHFETLSRFKAAINYTENPNETAKTLEAPIYAESVADRSARVVSMFLKAADIGHAGKPLEITRRMTIRIHMEFFAQGEEERELGLPISPLCDRNEVNVAGSQVGFLHHLVIPLYKAVHFFVTSDEFLNDCLNRLEANLSHWQSSNPCVCTDDIPDKRSSCDSTVASRGVFPQEQIVKLINGFE